MQMVNYIRRMLVNVIGLCRLHLFRKTHFRKRKSCNHPLKGVSMSVRVRDEEKRSGSELGFLVPNLTPALFSAPLTAESCNWMKDLLLIKSGYLNSNFDLIGL